MVWESLVLAVNSVWDILALHSVREPFTRWGWRSKCCFLTAIPELRAGTSGNGAAPTYWHSWGQNAINKSPWREIAGASILSVQLQGCSHWFVVPCPFYQQLELPVCPLLGGPTHPNPLCFQSRGFGHPLFPSPFVSQLKKRTCSEKTQRPLRVTQAQPHLKAEARRSEGFCVRMCINQSNTSYIASLGWECVQGKI